MIQLLPLALSAISALASSGKVAPEVGKALFGPKGEEAAKQVVGIAQAITGKPAEEAVAAIVADPKLQHEMAMKLEDNKLEFAKLAVEETKLFLADTQNARERDLAMLQAGYRNRRGNYMLIGAWLIIVIVLLALSGIFGEMRWDDFVKSTLLLIVGRALGYIDQGFNFEFGSTRSSQKKDDTIDKLSAR